MTTPTYAVVPSLGRECLQRCLDSLLPQVDVLVLVQTADFQSPVWVDGGKLAMIKDLSEPKNIHRWWNLGIDTAASYARMKGQSQWNVLIVNDDVISPPHLVETLDAGMREREINGQYFPLLRARNPVLAYPDNFSGDRCVLNRTAGPVDLTTRISGWCFMIRGESGLRAEESLLWWYGDDHLDWQAREMGGALMVPGCKVEHLYPGQLTGASEELTAQTHRDRRMFEFLWSGRTPH